MKPILILATAWFYPSLNAWGEGAPNPTIISATECGAVGDGVHDDGPAIMTMLKKATGQSGTVLRFSPNRSYFIKTSGESRYVFPFGHAANVTIDGGGSAFLVDSHLRFMELKDCRNFAVKNLTVDYVPLPFADGKVIAKNAQDRYIDVEISPGFALPPLGGPTHEDGEQAYFGMLWFHEGDRLLSAHYFIKDLQEASPGSLGKRVVRAFAAPDFTGFDKIEPGDWQISLPVRGVAHRYGPGATIEITQCENISFDGVEVFSAPWFAVRVLGCRGSIQFQRTNIRPTDGHLTSSWRDGFHVKGNSAPLLWDHCEVTGTNDDAFNISTHASRVVRVISSSQWAIHQNFNGGYIPLNVGDTLVAIDPQTGRLLGKSKIREVSESTKGTTGKTPPEIMVTLETPIEKIAVNSVAWDAETSNPDVTVRHCRINNSCRFQSPVRLENCDVHGFVWCYAADLEGPLPESVTVTDCLLQRGRGNKNLAFAVEGQVIPQPQGSRREDLGPQPFAVGRCVFENCRVIGDLSFAQVENLILRNNALNPNDTVSLRDIGQSSFQGTKILPSQETVK